MAAEIRRIQFTLRRSESDRALVEGIAYLSLDPPSSGEVDAVEADLRIDSWGTWMRRAVLEKFAHDFLTHGRAVDAHHDHGVIGNLVESYLTRAGNPDYPADAWVVKARVYDAGTLAELDEGKLTGFSIELLTELQLRTLLIAGASVRTGEMTDPLPLFLSLVERPAIGQPFTSIERRSAPAEGASWLAAPAAAPGRVTQVWRCAMDPTTNTPQAPATLPPAASVIDAPPAAPTQRAAEGPPAVVAVPATTAPAVLRRAAEEALGAERCLEIQQRAEGGDFAEAWAEIGPRAGTWAVIWEAYYLLNCILWNVRYDGGSDAEKYVAAATVSQEFADAIGAIAAAGGVTVATRGAPAQRAGAKHSKETRALFDQMDECLTAARGHLDTLRADPGKDDEDVKDKGEGNEDNPKKKSAPPEPAAVARAEEDEALRAQVKTLAERADKLDADAAAQAQEVDAARAARATAEAAQQRAERRVAELEAERPVSRGRSPEGDGAPVPAKRSGGGWGVLVRGAGDEGND